MKIRTKRYILITAISLIFFLSTIILGLLKYSTNDDTIMNLIAAGAFGESSQYLIYNSIIIGYILKFLYIAIPGVNWYLWMYLCFNLMAVIALSVVFSNGRSLFTTAAITTAINGILAYDFYSEIQFTQNASLYAVVGCIIIFSLLYKGKKSVFGIVAGTVFTTMAVMVRLTAAGLAIPFLFTALLFTGMFSKEKIKKTFLYFVTPLVVSIVCIGINFAAYYMNPDWKYFMEWNNIMVEKCDHGNYNFNWDKEAYLEAGFTENDFILLDQWVWNDTEYFNLDKLKTMKAIGEGSRQDRLRFDKDIFAYSFKKLAESPTYSAIPVLFVLMTVLSLILLKKRYRFLALAQSVWVYALYYVLVCSKRIMWRVECGIWLSAFFFTLFVIATCTSYKELKLYSFYDKFKRCFFVAFLAASIAFCIIYIRGQYVYFRDEKGGKITQGTDLTYDKVKAITEREGFYIVDVDTTYGDMNGAKNIFDIDRKYLDYYENFCQIGGWVQPSPIGLYHARLNDIDNPMRALVDREDVFYIGGGERAGYVYVFLNEKYGPGINMEMVDEVCGAPVWRFFR